MKIDPDDLPPQFRRPNADPPREIAQLPAEPPIDPPPTPEGEPAAAREEPFLRKS